MNLLIVKLGEVLNLQINSDILVFLEGYIGLLIIDENAALSGQHDLY